ncbi:hypothetical protein EJ06DRAFT_533143 [Trichodelitschia bisporula]|uniref:Autophagy-related protein 29 n=1 Tax=Trichodelitschia bisporula TaxID=703511 RepID=A0A6G1HNE7_9PEZI|nr:hypothetical protein EJ06DRAFT_533143 [Trichodelitschia bisporula]
MPPSQPTPPAKTRNPPPATASPRPEPRKRHAAPRPEVHYTLLIRVPFARGSFQDPQQVEWDAHKDRKLWKIISKNAKEGDLNWEERATEFGVTQSFLLQQAAWLYERHLQHVKAQMTKIRSTPAATPVSGSGTPAGGLPMKRLGSNGPPRAPSALSIRTRDTQPQTQKPEASVPGTPRAGGTRPLPVSRRSDDMAPTLSRTPSTTTITQSRLISSPRPPPSITTGVRPFRAPPTALPRPTAPTPTAPTPTALGPSPSASPPPPSDETSSSSSSDSSSPPLHRSQLFRRPPRFASSKPRAPVIGEEDDSDDSSSFLAYAPAPHSPSATLRTPLAAPPAVALSPPPGGTGPAPSKGKGKGRMTLATIESSASSASSALAGSRERAVLRGGAAGPAGGLSPSPRHRAELARLSPRVRGAAGSDGAPSMGSSFSDLDDTSISQSALEEALASNLRHGGASRLSTFGHAFRSRYL